LIAVVAVVLALALLIVGAIALIGALTNNQSTPSSSGATAVTKSSKSSKSVGAATTSPAAVHVLLVRITGASASVYVSTPGNAEALYKGTLDQGEVRYFDRPEMVVVVDPVENVEVQIRGKTVSKGKTGKQSWTADAA
jgi:hypothetical protein